MCSTVCTFAFPASTPKSVAPTRCTNAARERWSKPSVPSSGRASSAPAQAPAELAPASHLRGMGAPGRWPMIALARFPESPRKEHAMALMDFIKKQFIDILEWVEEGEGTLAWRYPVADREIQYGGSLTVRESQMAVFVNEGKVADVVGPGRYTLTTQTLPVLTYL